MESPNDDGTYGNYIIDLERRIELLLSENSELKAKLSAISTENEELKKRLMLYENPHTPPSRQMITPKISNPSGKRSAPMGHNDAKKVLGEPDERIHVSMERCSNCSHALEAPIRTEKKTISDISMGVRITELPVYGTTAEDMEIAGQEHVGGDE